MNDDTYLDRLKALPHDYILVDNMTCPKCGEETVYGDWVEDMGFDQDGTHPEFHGEFKCVNCNYKFTL